ncbi:hypothetical protein A3D71_04150 [Candidatus Kaiserbacteria bacterium RIFCSPHIGHO2_02_FULL_55_20]|uniref:phosphoribosylglycinamide formyltransferase 1 n=1 Tax=Candidatus Kaiserbacteria bacterium RIFCSPHIGHO2_02_FULL_55_20 TaxID=1798497 RepID=A0A1F6DZT6_9BACT|nr:MAG: hypothetical protein A2680_03325 [Candidatus Kaiserbacteria bacterium RIFCSPHIGHO2_01_FULL_55_37]OGG66502.1 MAG: hypothetical protein A3D71_04150 [Candidatus Kaiserbacteria bacterium RIFCSPHIGHO2_02_FULL_55_20]
MSRPKLIIFASGKRSGGGAGFENLVHATRLRPGSGEASLDADIVAAVSNHERGGIHERAMQLDIPFIYFPGPYDAEHYASVLLALRSLGEGGQKTAIAGSELWVALSGWLKHVSGLDPAKTFNIHPALLSQLDGRFGGKGMYGSRIHEAVKKALDAGETTETGFTMHFVTEEHDRGPAFFEQRVPLKQGMTAEEIGKAVNAAEHKWQPKITNMVVQGQIRWDGKNPESLVIPKS